MFKGIQVYILTCSTDTLYTGLISLKSAVNKSLLLANIDLWLSSFCTKKLEIPGVNFIKVLHL